MEKDECMSHYSLFLPSLLVCHNVAKTSHLFGFQWFFFSSLRNVCSLTSCTCLYLSCTWSKPLREMFVPCLVWCLLGRGNWPTLHSLFSCSVDPQITFILQLKRRTSEWLSLIPPVYVLHVVIMPNNMTNSDYLSLCAVGDPRTNRPGSGHVVNASFHALVYFPPQYTRGGVERLQVSCTSHQKSAFGKLY